MSFTTLFLSAFPSKRQPEAVIDNLYFPVEIVAKYRWKSFFTPLDRGR
jgi:hypothetical protein